MSSKLPIFFIGGLLLIGVWFLYEREASLQEEKEPSLTPSEKSINPLSRGVTVRSNSWFSSLYHDLPSAPLFVYPGVYQWTKEGLSVGAPQIIGTPHTVFGSFNELCRVHNEQSLSEVAVTRYGDFDIEVEARVTAGSDWRAHFMEGSPTVTLSQFTGDLKLTCVEGVILEKGTPGVWIAKQGEKIRFFVQAKEPILGKEDTLRSSEGIFRVVQWPTHTEKSIDFFLGLPWSEVADTQMQVEMMDGTVSLHLLALNQQKTLSLMTLWPHHRLAPEYSKEQSLGYYDTVLGRLELQSGNELQLRFSSQTLPSSFSPITDNTQREQIISALKEDTRRYQNEVKPEGVYFGGAWLGGLATLVQLADTYKLQEERSQLLDLLEKHLLESVDRFQYQEDKKMMVATHTEFGNEKGNDHHFHYGYYLRSAAILLQFRPELGIKLKFVMEELARDIATLDRTSTRFPFLRHFDPYAGHSWADGEARFADGNNQESTSEALNAWYALYLWSKTMGNTEREKLSQALYTYELMGTRAYWFGENNPFPTGFEHKMASLVWGGKRDYATWFSGQAMHIHGIQWLPVTPASGYLKTLPHFMERNQEVLRAHPNPASHEWGDLYTANLSFTEPEAALSLLSEAQTKRAMKSTALLYHTVYTNLEQARKKP